jgi:hypothetical protein
VVLELDDMPDEEREALIANGYPCLQLRSADGDSVVCLSSKEAGCGLDERMREGIGSCSMKRACQPWQVSRDLAALSGRAHDAEEAGRLSEAHRLYENLVAGGKGGLFSEAGEQGLHRIALAARDALLEARTVCERDPDGAERLLAEAVGRFRGTPHVAELEQVLEALRRTHEFPLLAWASY